MTLEQAYDEGERRAYLVTTRSWTNSKTKAASDSIEENLKRLENPVPGMRVVISDGEFGTWKRYAQAWSVGNTCVYLYDLHALPLLRAAVSCGAVVEMEGEG